jgi:hypothetical protein
MVAQECPHRDYYAVEDEEGQLLVVPIGAGIMKTVFRTGIYTDFSPDEIYRITGHD